MRKLINTTSISNQNKYFLKQHYDYYEPFCNDMIRIYSPE